MRKRFLTYILCVCLIIPAIFLFSACFQTPEIELKVENGYVRYYNGKSWSNLISVNDLKGKDGDNATGEPGKKVELDTSSTHIVWKYEDENDWKELIALELLKGPEGKKVELRVYEGTLQWHYVGESSWANLIKLTQDIPNVTVTFDTNGADATIPSQTIQKGSKITRPTTPIRDGYEFIGWEYDDQGEKDFWSFTGYTIDRNITLTAKWKEDFYTEGFIFGDVYENRNGFRYYTDGEVKGTLEIVQYTGNETEVVIPRTYKNKIVTGIFASAFQNSNVTSVVIPDTVKIIDEGAFLNCSSLSVVFIPESVETIEGSAFKNCTSLEEITLPYSVTSLGMSVFCGCLNLKSAVLNMKADTLPAYTFQDCKKLTDIDFNFNLKKIESYAFYNTDSLVNLYLPSSVKDLGSIYYCDLLENIRIPNGCLSIGQFSGCPKVKYAEHDGNNYLGNEDNEFHVLMNVSRNNLALNINENCKVIQNGALFETLKSIINIPASVIKLGNDNNLNISGSSISSFNINENNEVFSSVDGIIYSKDKTQLLQCPIKKSGAITVDSRTKIVEKNAFYNCEDITSVALPDSLTEIREYAFYSCANLTSIIIPKNVSYIAPRAFDGETLTSIIVDSNNSVYDSRNNCNAIIETESNTLIFACNTTSIPNNISCIGKDSFADCNLTYIILPSSVVKIENFGFSAYGNTIKTIYYNGTSSQWQNIEISDSLYFNNNVDVYFYVDSEQNVPNDNGNYWHYDTDGKTPIAW